MTPGDASASSRARLVVLVGPKGSGKTAIGKMLERPGVYFLEVETIARRVLAASGNVIDETYARRAFAEISRALRDIEAAHETIVIETTGASDETPGFIAELEARYDVRWVRVQAGADACVQRIAARDPSRHVHVPIELLQEMHARTMALDLTWDLELDNDPFLSAEQVEDAVGPLLRHAM